MTNPKKISMPDRRSLVDRTAGLIQGIQGVFPGVKVTYMSMFPHFVTKCCEEHMTEEDIWTMDSNRQDTDRDIREVLRDEDKTVTMVDWWENFGIWRRHDSDKDRGICGSWMMTGST